MTSTLRNIGVWFLLGGLVACGGEINDSGNGNNHENAGGSAQNQGGSATGGQTGEGTEGGSTSGGAAGGSNTGSQGGTSTGGNSQGGSSTGGGGTGGQIDTDVSLRNDVIPLFDRSCALYGCHTSPASSYIPIAFGPSENISATDVRQQLLDQTRFFTGTQLKLVEPGNSQQSLLVRKINGNWQGLSCEPQMGCGEKMPLKETFDGKSVEALTEFEIQQITLWVEQGAKDN